MNGFWTKFKDFFIKIKYEIIMFLIGVIVISVDITTKLITEGKEAGLIGGIVSIFSTHNTGAAWSIFSNSTALLAIISVVFLVIVIIANHFFKRKTNFYAISLGLVISGAIGNLLDRLKYGYVRDFIKLDFMHFPIFNIADCAITIGVIMLCIYFIFIMNGKGDKKLKKTDNGKILENDEITINKENDNE